MAGTFKKKTSGTNLPPAGTIKFLHGNAGPWTVDDTTHATITPSATDAPAVRVFTQNNHWLVEQ